MNRMDQPEPVFDEKWTFMMGGELALFNTVEGGVKLYSNAVEPWGVFIAMKDPTAETVEIEAIKLLRQQRPGWFKNEGGNSV